MAENELGMRLRQNAKMRRLLKQRTDARQAAIDARQARDDAEQAYDQERMARDYPHLMNNLGDIEHG